MNIFKPALLSTLLVATFAVSNTAHATAITCETSARGVTAGPATDCRLGSGNPKSADITSAFSSVYGSGLTWTNQGEVEGADGVTGVMRNNFLTVDVTSGSWGNAPAAGTFAIADTFWNNYTNAVLSLHVGHSHDAPQWFGFALDQNTTDGVWDYIRKTGSGGGLSNIKLWGSGTGTSIAIEVTEPAQLGILALGVLGLIASRRRQHKAS